ncbi:hypothetical protein [Mucilaginibacter sp. UYCu711]|uniref:hypothetical protein n=1 Tax=Mucilaginibacter sp. UYCu711 TaxID=3156339 RepID=UPI003D1DBCE7
MKRIYYLLAFVAVSTAFTACNPLDKTYKQLGDLPTPQAPVPTPTGVALTLSTADYGLLPKGHAAKTSLYFKAVDTAKVDIPLILAAKYPTYGDKSSINVTYAITPVTIKLADSLNANTTLTLQTTPTNDYVFPAYNGAAANTFSDFNAAAAINYLNYKYQVPLPEPSIRVMTYLYFESGKTASAGTLTTDAFLFMGGLWTKIYRISNAQYALTNNGLNNWYVAADAPNLPSYFNTILKADPAVMLTAKFGDVKYISYRYLTTYQRVLPMTFDGTNWVTTSTPLTLTFAKTSGAWVADNSVNYTLVKADYTAISVIPGVGSDAAMTNLGSFGNFNIQGGATTWTDAQINNGIATILKTKFTTAVVNQKFNISYAAYNGANIVVTKTFTYDGTVFQAPK